MHAARAGGLRPASQIVLFEDLARDERHAPNVVPLHSGAGIEVDAQLIGVIEIVGANGMRIQIDAAEVHDPEELGGVAHHDLLRRPSRRKFELHRLDPVGMLLRRALLKKRLGIGPVHVSLENDGTSGDSAQRAVGDGEVVLRQVELRVARLRKKDFVGIGDRDFAAGRFEDHDAKRSRIPTIKRLKSAPARAAVSITS